MPAPIYDFIIPGMGAELIYSFVIILCSLFIYFETKELYDLSGHKGIKHFRQAFLFFGIAYFFRYFIKFLASYIPLTRDSFLSQIIFGEIGIFMFVYFSTIAIFCLLYSMMCKKQNEKSKKIYLFHAISFITAVMSVLLKHPIIYLATNFAIFVSAIVLFFRAHKSNSKKNKLNAIYSLLFTFWSLNIIDTLIPDLLHNTQLFIYLVSIGLFITMLYRVTKKAGSH